MSRVHECARVPICPSSLVAGDSLPNLVVHADWGSNPKKRWMARAVLQENGCYLAHQPELVGGPGDLLRRLRADAGRDGLVFAGFDFPIGLPVHYARRVGATEFLTLLPKLGHGLWADFYNVAESPHQIGLHRPFYPQRSGGKRQRHLLDGLAATSIDDLRRRCERARPGRRAAASLFWTLGGQQVGKAAIIGWRDVLGPGLLDDSLDLAIWPFSGPLLELFQPGRTVIAETYPAEFYTHLGISFPHSRAGRRSGKRVQSDRVANAGTLERWTVKAQVALSPALQSAIGEGFGPATDGEDAFDAAVGLLGMLNILFGHRPLCEPKDDEIRRVEGWILGQH